MTRIQEMEHLLEELAKSAQCLRNHAPYMGLDIYEGIVDFSLVDLILPKVWDYLDSLEKERREYQTQLDYDSIDHGDSDVEC